MKKLFILIILFTLFLTGCTLKEDNINNFESYNPYKLFNCGYVVAGIKDENNNKKYVYLNTKGEECFDKQFEKATFFHKGVAIVKYEGLYYLMNNKGKFLTKGYEEIDDRFFGQENIIGDLIFAKSGEGMYILDINGKFIYDELIDPNTFSTDSLLFSNGNIITFKNLSNSKMGAVTIEGKLIIEPKYYSLSCLSDKYFSAKLTSESSYCLIDNNEKVIIQNAECLRVLGNKIFCVKKDGFDNFKYYNIYNEEVFKTDYNVYDTISSYDKAYLVVINNNTGNFNFIDENSNLMLEEDVLRCSIIAVDDYGYISVKKSDGKMYLYNDKFEEQLPKGYNNIEAAKINGILAKDAKENIFYLSDLKTHIKYVGDSLECYVDYLNNNHIYALFDSDHYGINYVDFYDKNLKFIGTIDQWDDIKKVLNIVHDAKQNCYYVNYVNDTNERKVLLIKNNQIFKTNLNFVIYANNGFLRTETDDAMTSMIINDDEVLFSGRISGNYIDGFYVYKKDEKLGIITYDGTKITDAIYEAFNNSGF